MPVLRYDFNNMMAERVGDHGVTEAELKALSAKIEAAGKALELNPPTFRTLPHTGTDRWSVINAPGRAAGASAINALCSRTGKLWGNPALTGAAMLYLADKAKGKNVHTILSYRQETQELIEWYRALLAESLGQRFGRTGKMVQCGQTPVTAQEPESLLQLCVEGPYDKVTTFITIGEPDLKEAGAEMALTKNGRPNCALRLERWDEETAGAVMFLLEMQTAYAGELYGVDVYRRSSKDLFTGNQKEQPLKPNPLFVVTA